MDLPYRMHLAPDNTGLWGVQQTEDAARTVSALLQEDMEVSVQSGFGHRPYDIP
jgi:hypothetical protein